MENMKFDKGAFGFGAVAGAGSYILLDRIEKAFRPARRTVLGDICIGALKVFAAFKVFESGVTTVFKIKEAKKIVDIVDTACKKKMEEAAKEETEDTEDVNE